MIAILHTAAKTCRTIQYEKSFICFITISFAVMGINNSRMQPLHSGQISPHYFYTPQEMVNITIQCKTIKRPTE